MQDVKAQKKKMYTIRATSYASSALYKDPIEENGEPTGSSTSSPVVMSAIIPASMIYSINT